MSERGTHFEEDEVFLSPESYPSGWVSAYTPKEADRLVVFRNVLEKIEGSRDNVISGQRRAWGRTEDGKVVEPYINLDGKFVHVFSRAVDSMYWKEFTEPHMRQAAEAIVFESKVAHDRAVEPMPEKQMRRLLE
jgi:hypothetical protein